MDISPITTTPRASGSRDTLISSYDAFLQLLTTQLRHQSPMEPLDANQFTEQLVQFSSVEQAIKTNENLARLALMAASQNAAALVSFIGSDVVAEGNTTRLKDGEATWGFDSSGKGTATVNIRNAAGQLVFSTEVAVEKGSGTFIWDGETDLGGTAPDGDYTIAIEAHDADGKVLTMKTEISGRVDGIDFSGDGPMLKIGNIEIPASAVKSVSRRPT